MSFEYCPSCNESAMRRINEDYYECFNCDASFDRAELNVSVDYDDFNHDHEHHHFHSYDNGRYTNIHNTYQKTGFINSLKSIFSKQEKPNNVAVYSSDNNFNTSNIATLEGNIAPTSNLKAYDVLVRYRNLYVEGKVVTDSPKNLIQLVANHLQSTDVVLITHKEIYNSFEATEEQVISLNYL